MGKERWSEGTKLKAAAVLQQLAGIATALGSPIPILQQWGEYNQQNIANLARYYEQKRQEKFAKQAKKKETIGRIIGTAGMIAGAGIGGLPGMAVSAAGGLAGSAISGGQVSPMDYMVVAPKGGVFKAMEEGKNIQPTGMAGIVKNVFNPQSPSAPLGILVKHGNSFFLVDPLTSFVLRLLNSDNNTQKKEPPPLAEMTSEGR